MNKKYFFYGFGLLVLISTIFLSVHIKNEIKKEAKSSISTPEKYQTEVVAENIFLGQVVNQVGSKNMNGEASTQFKVKVIKDYSNPSMKEVLGTVIVSVTLSNPKHLIKSGDIGKFYLVYDLENQWYILQDYTMIIYDF